MNERHPYSSNPLYSEHIARYHRRINDIFEKKEEEEEDEEEPIRENPLKSRFDGKYASSKIRTKPTFKSVLEGVKDLEKKYQHMNLEAEKKRIPTDFDHYRPDHNNMNTHYYQRSFQKLSDEEPRKLHIPSKYQIPKEVPDPITRDYKREDLYTKTLRLYRDAATPPSSVPPSSPFRSSLSQSQQYHISPVRYLAANLKTDIYNRYINTSNIE